MIRKYAIIGALLAAGVGAVGATVMIETQAARIRADSIDITVRGVGAEGDVTSWRIPAPTIAAPIPAPVPPAPTPPPPAPEPPPAPTPALTVTASPSTVASGGQVTFRWAATGITGTCTVNDGRHSVSGQPLSAQHVVSLTRTTTLTVRCGTLQRSATATVSSAPTPPPAPDPEPEPPVPPPAPGNATYPNEPAGVTVIRESSFSSLADGWGAAWNPSSEGLVLSAANDATAPISPSGVLHFEVPVGARAGGGPLLEYTIGGGTSRLYWAFWFKLSTTFPTKSMLFKLAFVEPNNIILVASKWTGDPNDGHHYLRVASGGGYPLANGTPTPLRRDVWHRAELLLDRSGPSGQHVLRWWVDGVLQGSYTNQSYSSAFGTVKFTPQESGSGGSNPTAFNVRIDHTRLSRW